jgi:hypothetical protein
MTASISELTPHTLPVSMRDVMPDHLPDEMPD